MTNNTLEYRLASLLDGCTELIEIYYLPDTPSGIAWKQRWLAESAKAIAEHIAKQNPKTKRK